MATHSAMNPWLVPRRRTAMYICYVYLSRRNMLRSTTALKSIHSILLLYSIYTIYRIRYKIHLTFITSMNIYVWFKGMSLQYIYQKKNTYFAQHWKFPLLNSELMWSKISLARKLYAPHCIWQRKTFAKKVWQGWNDKFWNLRFLIWSLEFVAEVWNI